jgi:hypothetical protein
MRRVLVLTATCRGAGASGFADNALVLGGRAVAIVGEAVGSPQNREHEMGDPVALDADRRIAEQDVF